MNSETPVGRSLPGLQREGTVAQPREVAREEVKQVGVWTILRVVTGVVR